MVMVTVILSVLLMSHVPYAVVPRISFRTRRGIFNLAWMLTGVTLAITVPRYYFFTALVLYTSWGLGKSLILGLLDRLPERDPLLDDEEEEVDDAGAEVRDVDYRDVAPVRFRKRGRRKPRGRVKPGEEPRKPDDTA